MPNSERAGMATSARHVVGLQDPPKNTSGASTLLPFVSLAPFMLLSPFKLVPLNPFIPFNPLPAAREVLGEVSWSKEIFFLTLRLLRGDFARNRNGTCSVLGWPFKVLSINIKLTFHSKIDPKKL